MATIKIRQGRKYWYVDGLRVQEVHITNGNVSSINLKGTIPHSLEVFGRLRVENNVAYIEGY